MERRSTYTDDFDRVMKPRCLDEVAWDLSGRDISMVFHGSKEFIKEIDPTRLQSRDHGFYGRGFYVSSSRSGARFYGGRISSFAVKTSARILRADVNVNKAVPGLVDAVMEHKYNKHIGRAKSRGKEQEFIEELEYIRTSHIYFKDAVNEYAADNDYDIIQFAPGEMVVKNLKVLSRVPTKRESVEEAVVIDPLSILKEAAADPAKVLGRMSRILVGSGGFKLVRKADDYWITLKAPGSNHAIILSYNDTDGTYVTGSGPTFDLAKDILRSKGVRLKPHKTDSKIMHVMETKKDINYEEVE